MNKHKYNIALPLMSPGQSAMFIRNAESINVLDSIKNEVEAQHEKWGEQNHADFVPNGQEVTETREGMLTRFAHGFRSAAAARDAVERLSKEGLLTFAAIFREEAAEAIEEAANGDEDKLITELVQTAAVIVSWIGAIRRRQRDRWAEAIMAVEKPGASPREEDVAAAGLARKLLAQSSTAVMKTALELAGIIKPDDNFLLLDGVDISVGKEGELPSEMARLAEALGAWAGEGRVEAPRDYVQFDDYTPAPPGAELRMWTRKDSTRIHKVGNSRGAFNAAKAKVGDILAFVEPCDCSKCNGGYSAFFVCEDAIISRTFENLYSMLAWVEGVSSFNGEPTVVTRKSLAN